MRSCRRRCFPALVKILPPPALESLIKPLVANITTNKEAQLSEMSTHALKVILAEPAVQTNEKSGTQLMRTLVVATLEAAVKSQSVSEDVLLEVLDMAADLFRRQGRQLAKFQPPALELLQHLLSHKRMAVRKRAIKATGAVAVTAAPEVVAGIAAFASSAVGRAMAGATDDGFGSSADADAALTVVQLIACVAREGGDRAAPHLLPLMPQLGRLAAVPDADELREACVQAYEALATRAPREFATVFEGTLAAILGDSFLLYDTSVAMESGDEARPWLLAWSPSVGSRNA